MYFQNPALLAGAALFVVPLVIHLLNRQRHRRRPWAAMEFLLRAYQKQRNRLRNENLLLLLLRCLIPLVLALAIARPVLRSAGVLPGGGGGVHHVVVLDASYSMGVKAQGQSPFDHGRALVLRLLERLEGKGDRGDKVTLVTAGVRPRFVVRSDLNVAGAKARWLQVQRPEDAAGDLTEAMVQVAAALDEAPDAAVQVYLLTDMQQRALGRALAESRPAGDKPGGKAGDKPTDNPAGGAPATGQKGEKGTDAPEFQDTLRDVCERLGKHANTRLHVIDVGPFADQHQGGQLDNLQLTGLRIEQPAAVVRVPVPLVATLKNRGQASASIPVTLEVDGQEPERKVVTVAAGGDAEAEFQVTFRETGRHRLRASIQNDALEADDEWFTTIEVRDRLHVLLVDGTAGDDPLKTHQWLWQSVLDPTQGRGTPDLTVFDVKAIEPLQFLGGQLQPAAADVLVLADVDRLNDRSAATVRQFLDAGKGVFVVYGEHADLESYNLHLYGAGDGLQPFRLLRAAGGAMGSGVARTPSLVLPEHPVFREFDEPIYREVLQAVPVWRWVQISDEAWSKPAPDAKAGAADRPAPAPGAKPAAGTVDVQVLARLTDPDQSPLLIARQGDAGKALFLLSAPTSEYRPDPWNRLADRLIVYQLLHGAMKWLVLPAIDPFQAVVGGELACTVPGRPEGIEFVRAERDGGAKVPVSEEPRPLASGRYALPPYTATEFAGFYTCELTVERDQGKEHLTLPFAVDVDPDEGELRYAAHDDVRQALAIDRVLTGLPQGGSAAAEPEQSEFGPLLLLLTLLAVVGEAAMARYVSVRRA